MELLGIVFKLANWSSIIWHDGPVSSGSISCSHIVDGGATERTPHQRLKLHIFACLLDFSFFNVNVCLVSYSNYGVEQWFSNLNMNKNHLEGFS